MALSDAEFLIDAKTITVNVFNSFLLDDDGENIFTKDVLHIRSEAEFERIFSKYGAYPLKEDTNRKITCFEDLVDGENYLVSHSALGRVSTIENAILRRKKDFETMVCSLPSVSLWKYC